MMEGARLKWRRTTTAALLGFLPLTLLIPGAFALRCHSFTSIQPVSGDQISSGFSEASSIASVCSAGQTACVVAHLGLSTEKTAMLVIHRGCASGGHQDKGTFASSGNQHLTVHSGTHYCLSDLCNGGPVDLSAFKMPEQEKTSEASSSNQCYSGFTLDSDQDILDRVSCGGDRSQCYHGNGTITVGHLAVDFLIKACQDPSCTVPESQSFGPIQLKLWGSCCRGAFCNGVVAAPQIQKESTTTSAQHTTTPLEADASTQPTDFPEHDVENDTQDTSTVPVEVTDSPDREWDVDGETATLRNPLYDYEEDEDDIQLPVATNNTLNPRAANCSPKSSLPAYLLLANLGTAILKIW